MGNGDEGPGENRYCGLFTLFVLVMVGVVNVLRSYNAFAYPILFCEDGPDLYAYYLVDRSPASVFKFYANYVCVAINLWAYLCALLPPKFVAYAMSAGPLILTCAAYAAFSLKRFRFLVRDDATRAFICIILAWLTLGNTALVCADSYLYCHVMLLLLLFTLAPAPTSTAGTVLQAALVAIAVWSHPLSIVCVPICLAVLVFRKSWHDRVLNIWTIAVSVLYFFLGTQRPQVALHHIWPYLTAALRYTPFRVVFESLYSNGARCYLGYRGWTAVMWAGSALAAALGLALALLRKERHDRYKSVLSLIAVGVFAYVMTFLSLLARSVSGDEWMGPLSQRYFYVSKIFVVGTLLALVFETLRERNIGRGLERFLMTLLMGYLLSLNVTDSPIYNNTTVEEGQRLRGFLSELQTQLERKAWGEPYTAVMKLDRGGRWDINIDLRRVTSIPWARPRPK
jgi:hypothetical protein